MNGNTIGFQQQTQKLELHYTSPLLSLGGKELINIEIGACTNISEGQPQRFIEPVYHLKPSKLQKLERLLQSAKCNVAHEVFNPPAIMIAMG